jgi:hypothetical protein
MAILEAAQRDSCAKKLKRREFIGAVAAMALFPLEELRAELVLHNGNIVTVNARFAPWP